MPLIVFNNLFHNFDNHCKGKNSKDGHKIMSVVPARLPFSPKVSVTKVFDDLAKGFIAAFKGEENL